MELVEARAVVTGGAQGMGAHFVRRLRDAGARVVGVDVQAGADLVADVSDEDAVARMLAEAEERLGGVPNVLVNNAGIVRDGFLLKLDKAKWDAVLAVNLTGPFLCTRGFARRAVETGTRPAVVINMSSISRAGNMGQSNYSAAKAGLVADTRVWAKELGRHGIRVTAIAPGFVRTPMVEAMRPEVLEKIVAPVPLGRLGEPEDVWKAVRFAVECDYFTGRVVEVDGGLVL